MYIPDKLFVPGNVTGTANNIAAYKLPIRLGIVGELVGAIIRLSLKVCAWNRPKRE